MHFYHRNQSLDFILLYMYIGEWILLLVEVLLFFSIIIIIIKKFNGYSKHEKKQYE